jgi:DNA modification methylase
MASSTILVGDCLEVLRGLPHGMAQTCVTSPPYYGLRDYGHVGQIGLEETPDAYVTRLVDVFREVRRALRDDGTLWLNLGDSYAAQGGAHGGRDDNQRGVGARRLHIEGAGDQSSRRASDGYKPKDLFGIPWMVAFALRADGWWLRQDIIWHKPNPMPESVTDRCTKAHEYVFLLTKNARYFYDADSIREAPTGRTDALSVINTKANNEREKRTLNKNGTIGANARSVWPIATQPYSGAHFATMPPALAERCIKAGSKPGDMVLDPFGGAGTTGLVADRLGRSATLIELNPEYARLARERITADAPLLGAAQ